MKTGYLLKLAAGVAVLFHTIATAFSAVTFSVDMIPGGGIDSTRTVSPGDTFTVDLMMNVDVGGVSYYSISAMFNTGLLQLNPTTGGAAANDPGLPGGLTANGTPLEMNALGQVWSFSAGTAGTGPASTTFRIGSINYMVPLAAVVPNDAVADITIGLFHFPDIPDPIDAFRNNSDNPVIPVFNHGFLQPVPEPTTWTLLACGAVAALVLPRRRRSS